METKIKEEALRWRKLILLPWLFILHKFKGFSFLVQPDMFLIAIIFWFDFPPEENQYSFWKTVFQTTLLHRQSYWIHHVVWDTVRSWEWTLRPRREGRAGDPWRRGLFLAYPRTQPIALCEYIIRNVWKGLEGRFEVRKHSYCILGFIMLFFPQFSKRIISLIPSHLDSPNVIHSVKENSNLNIIQPTSK